MWDKLAIGQPGTAVARVAFSGDGEILAAGCSDGSIGIWRIAGIGGFI
ncbi:MAG: WD40 repeat domain-containing protein [Cyanobacteriota bacterium]|nr:WD40 repeat domain-containing protein [Cyanobacteriota bacterium]